MADFTYKMNGWKWDDEDEDDLVDFHEMRSVPQCNGVLAVEKMKIVEDEKEDQEVDMDPQDELLEALRATGLQYKDGIDLRYLEKVKHWEDENRFKIASNGRVPLFVGKELFSVVTPPSTDKIPEEKAEKPKQMRYTKRTKTKSITSTKSHNENNPFRAMIANSAKPDSNPFRCSSAPLTVQKNRRMTVAQQILNSVELLNEKSRNPVCKYQ